MLRIVFLPLVCLSCISSSAYFPEIFPAGVVFKLGEKTNHPILFFLSGAQFSDLCPVRLFRPIHSKVTMYRSCLGSGMGGQPRIVIVVGSSEITLSLQPGRNCSNVCAVTNDKKGLVQFSMLYPLFLLVSAVPGSFPAIIEFWGHHFCFIYVEYIIG